MKNSTTDRLGALVEIIKQPAPLDNVVVLPVHVKKEKHHELLRRKI